MAVWAYECDPLHRWRHIVPRHQTFILVPSLTPHSAPFVSDFLQEHFFGRRGAIAIACFVSIGATVGQCFSTSVAQIIGCRVITGLTLAAKASSAPLLAAEVAPNHIRGKPKAVTFIVGNRLINLYR
jgi:MFS family permease